MPPTLYGAASELGFELTNVQVRQFERYADVLLSSGRRMGITSIEDRARIERRHFVESLAVARALIDAGVLDASTPSRVLDVGTGGGLPGLPIRIALPGLRLTLLDARQRTVAFVEGLLDELRIDDVDIVTARAEEAAHEPAYRERFDVVLARAVAPLPVLLELTLPFLRTGGHLAAPKGSGVSREIEASQHALDVLGGEIVSTGALPSVGGPVQRLVIVRKTFSTPPRFPRRAGIPKKRPL